MQITCGKKVIPPNNSKNGGAKREDVMYKILLRTAKRFYWKIWCDNNNLIHTKTKEEELPIFDRIDEVCKARFTKYFSEDEIEQAPHLRKLHEKGFCVNKSDSEYFRVKILVACLTARLMMKKYVSKWNLRRTYAKYYDVISKYSCKRLHAILSVKAFRIIFDEFFNSEDFEEMLQTDESLKEEQVAYRERANVVLSILAQKEQEA